MVSPGDILKIVHCNKSSEHIVSEIKMYNRHLFVVKFLDRPGEYGYSPEQLQRMKVSRV